jgi:hypothetical protein
MSYALEPKIEEMMITSLDREKEILLQMSLDPFLLWMQIMQRVKLL